MRVLSSVLVVAAFGSILASAACSTDDPTADPGSSSGGSSGASGSGSSSGASGSGSSSGSTPTATDGVKNGTETDVDCGGSAAPPCGDGKGCGGAADCASQVCNAGVCAAPSATDGVKNGDESDVDCGGAKAPKCAVGKACKARGDCASDVCTGGTCQEPTPADGVKNGTETDVDCGGPGAPRCADTKTCSVADDCTSGVCKDVGTGKRCQAPSPTDGVKNGDESDVDCGGAKAPKCGSGKACNAHADCASDGCAFDGKCAVGRSCTRERGGVTCGKGETGELGAAHESCCETVTVPRPAGQGGPYQLDKYLVTAGRIRAFVDRVGGNVRDAVSADPKWNPAWTAYMPTNMAEAQAQLGPMGQDWEWPQPTEPSYDPAIWRARGCQVDNGGARSFYLPAAIGGETQKYSQDVLDEKMINCITTPMLLAFCIWDGKDLPMREELAYAWTAGDPTNHDYPWGNSPTPPATQYSANDYVAHKYSYQFPAYVGPDATTHVPAPGRHYLGLGPFGHADLAGATYEIARNGYLNSGSWENHAVGTRGSTSSSPFNWNRRYYAIGGRCGSR